ncbi:glutamine amidotransferase [Vibrio sp. DW001]|uniref:glutamine amidotransferase n=1 Tax=Vibrio sp. DW001 TaxID=2912315 RepID=UPI0023B1E17C|nr:glutamine amidotransferase [Vibrio sp. DW001]WED26471.1 glutamine amidotransferase [Vibrio sp. DW001]
MKKIIIVNVGSAPEAQYKKFGDFEIWAKNAITEQKLTSDKQTLDIIFHDGILNPLPNLDTIAGVIIMGSLSMATEKADWMLRLSTEISQLVHNQIPLLGICFGHQLIAQAMGGEVGYHPKGLEIGTVDIYKLSAAEHDPIFAHLPAHFSVHAVHFQSVLTLPKTATLLASNDFEPHHAFRIGKCTWGVQFHPEFTADIMRLSLAGLRSEVTEDYTYKQTKIKNCIESRSLLLEFANFCSRTNK